MSEYNTISKKEQESYEINTVDKANENPNLFPRFIRRKLSVRLRDFERRITEDNKKIYE